MNSRKTLVSALLSALMVLSVPQAQAQSPLTLSVWLPTAHPVPQALLKWTQELEQASNGRLKAQLLSKPVTAPPGTYNAVRDGLADISFTVLGYTPGRFTLSEFVELPLMSSTAEQGSVAFHRVANKHKAVMDEYREVKVLALFVHGPGVIMNSKKELMSVSDMQGLKFRVGGGIVNDVTKALAINSTLKPAGDSYELMSTGVMDGTWLPVEGITTFKLDKVVRHVTTVPGGIYNSAFIAMMNKKTYDGLSKEDQALVDKTSGENLARMLGRGFDSRDREGKALAQASGIKVATAPDAMVKEIASKVGALEEKWMNAARAKGIAQPDAVLADFRAEAKK
jgi:TRAP-type C4-dicarboxylate transport system substrate-binding protein